MKFTRSLFVSAVTLFALLAGRIEAAAQPTSVNGVAKSYAVSFDVPGAGTGAYQGTFVDTVNLVGIVTGYYLDESNVYHGFLRSPNGILTTFDAPGADTNPGDFNGTLPATINDLGDVVGVYYDISNVGHGFVRNSDGGFVTFDPPGLGSSGIILHSINLEGSVVGSYLDPGNEYHGFLRKPDGSFTTFEAPGACHGGLSVGCHGTGAWNINLFGTIVGAFEDNKGNFVAHTYIRNPDGTFKTFSVPGSSMQAGQGTLPAVTSGLNDLGAITGNYYDTNNVFHGFVRKPNGVFIKFEVPGADTVDSFYGTFPQSINDLGAITGFYLDVNGVYHGFLRASNNNFTSFDATGADLTAGDFNGTFPTSINLFGTIAGSYVDANSAYHGFLWISCLSGQVCPEKTSAVDLDRINPNSQSSTDANQSGRGDRSSVPIQHRLNGRWVHGQPGAKPQSF